MIQNDDLFYLGLKCILRNQNNQVLLLKMHKNGQSFWELPGGRIQQQETPEQGLRREIEEETGIVDVSNMKHISYALSQYRVATNHKISAGLLFSLYCATTSADHVTLSQDHVDYRWVWIEDITQMLRDCYSQSEETIQFLKNIR